jgi:nucleoid-associated protein YgaU
VANGDTLFRIALKYYGDGNRFKDVLAANRSVLSNPQDLRPGMKLVIP